MAKLVNRISRLRNRRSNYIIKMVENAYPVSTRKGLDQKSRSEYIIDMIDDAVFGF